MICFSGVSSDQLHEGCLELPLSRSVVTGIDPWHYLPGVFP